MGTGTRYIALPADFNILKPASEARFSGNILIYHIPRKWPHLVCIESGHSMAHYYFSVTCSYFYFYHPVILGVLFQPEKALSRDCAIFSILKPADDRPHSLT